MEFCDRLGRDSKGVFNIRTTGVIDLGGVAKGFAVDRAVEALKSHGIDAGIVNAGGDMAVFGPRPQAVHRRDPAQPARLLPPIGVFNAALASSAPAFDPVTGTIAPDSAIVDPRTGAPAAGALGASVRAPQAMAADALTKLVMILGGQAWPVLAQWQADGWLVRRDGGQDRTPGWMEI
jgi:thiamine biosynthesis lipoprotein